MELTGSRIAAAVVVLVLATSLVWWLAARGRPATRFPVPGEDRRVVVEVLNGTTVVGLARVMTTELRRAGIDVVYFGNWRESALDSTLILIRRGDSSFAGVIRDAIGAGRVVLDPDPRLLLDASVVLGRDVAAGGDLDP
ncbi:MAG: LytR C-terminal domain-containing protein [Gemmatimonadota bacterium]|nr:MAG: LytR C-terminal domain-containing protein [Gemmatimonadota bacterium]